MDNNNQTLTPDGTTPTAPSVPQQSPFGLTPSAPVNAQPVDPIIPTQPQQPVQPAAPVIPAQPIQPQAPVQPAMANPGSDLNTTQNIQTTPAQNMQQAPMSQQPTQGAFVPQAMSANKVAREEVYQENMMQKAHRMRDILRTQPKVWAMVPLQPGEKPGTMLPVGINGYFIYIKKGVMVQVPRQVGEMLAASFNLDYENGAEIDLSRNEDKQRALS